MEQRASEDSEAAFIDPLFLPLILRGFFHDTKDRELNDNEKKGNMEGEQQLGPFFPS